MGRTIAPYLPDPVLFTDQFQRQCCRRSQFREAIEVVVQERPLRNRAGVSAFSLGGMTPAILQIDLNCALQQLPASRRWQSGTNRQEFWNVRGTTFLPGPIELLQQFVMVDLAHGKQAFAGLFMVDLTHGKPLQALSMGDYQFKSRKACESTARAVA